MDTMNPIVQPTPVDITAIERELTLLWQHAADSAITTQPVTRACTLNLVACAPDRRTAEHLTGIIQEITRSHPNRTVMITNDPESPESRLDAWVQANCQLTAPGASQVCGEQISIDARGKATAQVTSLVLSLLLPDLPVVLWWAGHSPFEDTLFQRLRKLTDRVIIDSANFTHPNRDIQGLADTLGCGNTTRSRYAISDLNWARLTPWRELTAQFFDARILLPHLRRLDKIVIDYEYDPNRPANRIQALLLAGWLTTRLGWSPLDDSVSVEGNLVRFHLRRPAPTVGPNAIRLVTVELHAAPVMDHSPDTLAALRLLALDNILASFVVERTGDAGVLRTTAEVTDLPAMTRLARVERPSDADMLANELRLLSNDRTYEEALCVAGRLALGLAG